MSAELLEHFIWGWMQFLHTVSPLHHFLKFNNFLWVCWFLGKNLSNFVPPIWKLDNPCYHNVNLCPRETRLLKRGLFLLLLPRVKVTMYCQSASCYSSGLELRYQFFAIIVSKKEPSFFPVWVCNRIAENHFLQKEYFAIVCIISHANYQ